MVNVNLEDGGLDGLPAVHEVAQQQDYIDHHEGHQGRVTQVLHICYKKLFIVTAKTSKK